MSFELVDTYMSVVLECSPEPGETLLELFLFVGIDSPLRRDHFFVLTPTWTATDHVVHGHSHQGSDGLKSQTWRLVEKATSSLKQDAVPPPIKTTSPLAAYCREEGN